ncbi:chymotrypsin family serine protease [Anditalea andensis]|uniref:Peptidase S1 domain-containing protein n=1 Tax=Anditalea andensis TaxID=1048983 RepID=A0A074KYP8_9BACT|nr:hypothetical protein [Anditalea andensis]KEO72743.1 hypothetical protein EL17_18615 [Anditalea andensis]
MKRKFPFGWIAVCLIGILVGAIFTRYVSDYSKLNFFQFTIGNLIIISVIIICILVVNFIKKASINSDKKAFHSFGLPAGTVRATLALLLIVFFILFAFYAVQFEVEAKNERLVENILTTLATLVISAVSFYFGVKATEQGSEIATRIWGESKKRNDNEYLIDPKIIQEALSQHKDDWIKEYECRDIRLGKKQTEDGQINMDCLVFLVDNKKGPSSLEESSTNSIPSIVRFDYQGKTYSIPTDVRIYSEFGGKLSVSLNTPTLKLFENLHPDAQKGIIREFIQYNGYDLVKQFPEIQGISDFKKIINGTQHEYYSIQFKVAIKNPDLKTIDKIPPFFDYEGSNGVKYMIPSDVIEEGLIEEAVWTGKDLTTKCLGLSVSRRDANDTGTIGLKVFWKEKYYLMTCCHVLFKNEIDLNPDRTFFKENAIDIISPGTVDMDGNKYQMIGKLEAGWYDSFLDIALAELIDPAKLTNIPHQKKKEVAGIKDINSERDQGTVVKMYGRTSHEKEGRIVDYSQLVVKITNRKSIMRELLVCDFKSEKGDSGAVVIESSTNKIIGILVARSDAYSYVIKIRKILNLLEFDDELKPWIS